MSKDNFSKNAYCPLAWIHSFVNQDGSMQVCCTSEEYDNFIRDDENKKIYISDPSNASAALKSNFMNKVRKDMLEGNWPEFCARCEYAERAGGISRRQIEIKNYNDVNDKLVSGTKEDGSTEAEILSADYRLGNLCNLQCRMCNPRSSTMWIKEWNEIKPEQEKFSQSVLDSYKQYNWINSEFLVKDFEEKAPSLRHIHFAGGEPLIVPQMKQILQRCVDSGNAKNITITYNTNLTKLPEAVIKLWPHFKEIKILASIDAYGELNNYIRYPSKWEVIDKNLKYIDKHHKELNVSECMLSSTVQILNVLKLDELYEYLEQFEFIVSVPNLVNCTMPSYFRSSALPQPFKTIATLKLRQLVNKYSDSVQPYHRYLIENITQIISFMNGENGFEAGIFNYFLEFQEKFDREKNLSLGDYYPQFESFKNDTQLPFEKRNHTEGHCEENN